MPDRRRFLVAFSCCVLATLAGPVAARAQEPAPGEAPRAKPGYPRTIVLVRHAEKATEPKTNPPLTSEGVERSKRLARMFGASSVTHLVASEFQRTQQTLGPLALATKVQVQVVPSDPAATQRAIELLPQGALVVVAGHSDTLPQLAKLLTGGQAEIAIADTEHDRVFVITQWGPGKQSNWFELRY